MLGQFVANAAAARPNRRRLRALAGGFLSLMIGSALVLGSLVGAPQAAQAASNPSSGFQAGNIISDANFYNADAMTTGDIQRFLNAQVPKCTIGQSGRKAGSTWGNTKVASNCLKDATFTTSARAANAYCKAYSAVRGQSAASIIRKVARACSISPRVLLIMLEKEQSLVTDTWPTVRQYDFAMGFDCPDSGPGNSANCSSSAGGFAYQVYRGAMQLQVYKANPTSYRYRAFQTNTVQWHPNTSCGTSQVYIENRATAALYIYTPYRPNSAALQAGWGTGDGCSSYGNRNFYNFYTSWFGSPTSGYAVHAKLKSLYNSQKSTTGKPTALAKSIPGGIYQDFAKARMYWTSKGGASVVRGHILPVYKQMGEVSSQVGAPTGVQRVVEKAHNQRFVNGEIFWKKSTGAYVVRGTTYRAYKTYGGNAKLGAPLANQIGSTTRGVMQEFKRGSTRQILTWSAHSNPKLVTGDIRKRYLSDGGLPTIGYALAKANDVPGGMRQRFSKADIYWTDSKSIARSVRGEILKTMRANGDYSKIGLPTSYQFEVDGGIRQNFEKKAIVWTKSGGGKVVSLSTVGVGKAISAQVENGNEQDHSEPSETEESQSGTTGIGSAETDSTADVGVDAAAADASAAADSETGADASSGAADSSGADTGDAADTKEGSDADASSEPTSADGSDAGTVSERSDESSPLQP